MYITGQTGSSDFPAVPPEDQSVPGDDAFVIKLAPGNGSQLRREQSRGPEDCLDCKLHWVAANWFTFWPVNTRTGSYYTSVTDLAVQSPGPEIVWSRSYASQATADLTTTLGFGWQHPYSARLMLPLASGSDVTVLSGKGNQLHFSYNNGSYTPDPGIYSTLAHGTGVYTQTLLDQQQLVFSDTTGRLTGMVDSLGRKITLTYSGSPAQLTQIADANDTTRKLTLTYTSSRITQVSDGSRNVNYTYSAAGDLATVQDVRSQITNYTYQNHLLTQIKDPLNQIVEGMGYVGIGNASQVITQTIQDGRKFDFSYLPSGTTVMTSTGVDGRRTVQRFVYGSNGALSGVIDTTNPDPTKWQPLLSSGFDASFSPSSITDGNTNTTTGTYTSNGLPLQQTNALSQTTKFQYDTNRPAVITDTLGIKTLYGYDLLGNLLNVTAGVTTTSTIRATTVYTYSYLNASNVWTTLTQPLATPLPKDSRLLEQRSPDGVVTHYDYDATKAHQVVKMTVGFGTALKQETTYLYDSFGRVTSVTAAANNSTIARKDTTTYNRKDTTTYNLDNTVAQTVQNYKDGVFDSHKPDEDVITTYGYDLLGRQIWVKDALGHYDVTYYNPKGQVSSTIRNLSGFNGGTTLPANPPGYSATLPDANIATSYGYDSLGRTVLVTETGILTGTFNTSTVQFSAADTRMTKTEYDTLSRPVTVTLNYRPGLPQTADSNIPLYTRYDGAGNVITQTDALGRWTVMEYDKLNRPIKTIANYQDGLPLTGPRDADIVTTTEYDAAGRVKQQTDNWVDGTFVVTQPITDRVTLYQYDTLSRLKTTISNYLLGNSSNELNRTSTTEYHPSTGRVTGQQDSLGRWVNQQYDLLGRTIKSIQNCTNTSGTPVNPAQTACATFNSSFTDRNVPAQTAYDTLNRTTIVTDALNIETRTTYDGLGRVLKTIRNYKNGAFDNNFPDEDVATSYRYDALGRTLAITQTVNATTNAVTQHAVNALGQVTSATDPQGRVTLSGYDGAGVLRWTKRADGQITVYKVDGLGRTIATIVNYINGQRDASDKTDQDLINTTVYDAAGRRLQQIQRSDPADVVTVFVYNNQDLLIGVTENAASGTCPKTPCNVITQYQYDRAGNRTAITDPRGIADPQGKTRTFDYDAANQQIKATEPVSATFTRVTQWTYDAGGRMTGTTDPRGASNNLTLTYDGRSMRRTPESFSIPTMGAAIAPRWSIHRRTVPRSTTPTSTTGACSR